MKKELYWPIGIIVILTLFIGFLISFFIFTRTVPLNLVSEEYYEDGMSYQQQIDRISKTQEVFGEIDWQYHQEKQIVTLTLPALAKTNAFEGKIHFYRPSDASLDFSVPLKIDQTGAQILNVANLKSGLWRVKVLWETRDSEFFAQSEFTKS